MSRTAHDFKAAVLKALAHPNRLRILEALRCDETCNCALGPTLKLEQSNLSRHLLGLSEAGLVVVPPRRDAHDVPCRRPARLQSVRLGR